MSREVRRVPLDFNFPIGETWSGYLMPDRLREAPCPDCRNGMTWAAEWLYKLGERINMLAADIGVQDRGREMHPYLAADMDAASTGFVYDGTRRISDPKVMRPTRDILPLVAGLTGHDEQELMDPMRGMDYRVGRKLIEAAGLDPATWGTCPTCEGTGARERYEGQRAEAEAWEATEPPAGDGWQLWQTVSEGGPVTPVFETAEGLIDHLEFQMGWRRSAAEQLVADGSTIGTGVLMGGRSYDSAEDADIVRGRAANP